MEHLAGKHGKFLVGKPWLEYQTPNANQPRYCQPDALIVHPGRCFILEIKQNHAAEAFFQLQNVYRPVVRHLFDAEDDMHFFNVEICNIFDCATRLPEKPMVVDNLYDAHPERFNVLIWHP